MESSTKSQGRPKGSLNKIQNTSSRKRKAYTAEDPPRIRGRPKVYVNQNNVFVNRIIALKYKFKLEFPEREDYLNKTDIELVDVLIRMETEISEIKLKRRLDLMEAMNFKESNPTLYWTVKIMGDYED